MRTGIVWIRTGLFGSGPDCLDPDCSIADLNLDCFLADPDCLDADPDSRTLKALIPV